MKKILVQSIFHEERVKDMRGLLYASICISMQAFLYLLPIIGYHIGYLTGPLIFFILVSWIHGAFGVLPPKMGVLSCTWNSISISYEFFIWVFVLWAIYPFYSVNLIFPITLAYAISTFIFMFDKNENINNLFLIAKKISVSTFLLGSIEDWLDEELSTGPFYGPLFSFYGHYKWDDTNYCSQKEFRYRCNKLLLDQGIIDKEGFVIVNPDKFLDTFATDLLLKAIEFNQQDTITEILNTLEGKHLTALLNSNSFKNMILNLLFDRWKKYWEKGVIYYINVLMEKGVISSKNINDYRFNVPDSYLSHNLFEVVCFSGFRGRDIILKLKKQGYQLKLTDRSIKLFVGVDCTDSEVKRTGCLLLSMIGKMELLVPDSKVEECYLESEEDAARLNAQRERLRQNYEPKDLIYKAVSVALHRSNELRSHLVFPGIMRWFMKSVRPEESLFTLYPNPHRYVSKTCLHQFVATKVMKHPVWLNFKKAILALFLCAKYKNPNKALCLYGDTLQEIWKLHVHSSYLDDRWADILSINHVMQDVTVEAWTLQLSR